MIYELYCIKDTCTGLFNEPKCLYNEAHAKRWYNEIAKESKIGKDLQLYKLGTFDVKEGKISSDVVFICGGIICEE